MYTPEAFRSDDIVTLHTLMQEYNFATLVTMQPDDGVPIASHLPFVIDTQHGSHGYGTLVGHMARANPQWRSFASEREVLVIFQGPHAYISPSWYAEALSVPTWNYAVVHAYGKPRIVEDATILHDMLRILVEQSEAQFEKPWPFDLPQDYMQKMMRGIVGFEIEISRLEGKFKLNQNRSLTDQVHVAATLQSSGDTLSEDVAQLMQGNI
jgi:transcriptional regulator